MPIISPILSESLDQKRFGQLDYCVMRHAFECHNDLGRLCDEIIYQNDLAARLQAAGIPVEKEAKLVVTHRDFEKIYWLDLVVAQAGIYELKTHSVLVPDHEAQLLTTCSSAAATTANLSISVQRNWNQDLSIPLSTTNLVVIFRSKLIFGTKELLEKRSSAKH